MMIVDVDTIFGFWPARYSAISLDRLLFLMAKYGIDRACTCSARGIWYDDTDGNTETIDATQSHNTLIPVATIDPRKFVGSVGEMRRMLTSGCRLFRLFPEYQGWAITSPSAHRILKMLDDAGVILVLGGPASQLPDLRGLQIPIILVGAHFYQLADVLACSADMPNVYLTTRLLIGPGSLEIAVSHLGHERVLFGSNAPLAYMASALRVVQHANLSAEQQAAILGGNLQRLLGGSSDRGY